jgi:hypothetical protein
MGHAAHLPSKLTAPDDDTDRHGNCHRHTHHCFLSLGHALLLYDVNAV